MSLYLGGLLVGIVGMAMWIFFWRLSENEKLPNPVRVFMNLPLAFGLLIFGLNSLSIIGIWLDLRIANSYGIAVDIVGLTLTFVIEFVTGAVIGLLPFWITGRTKFWFRRYRRRQAIS